MVNTAVREAAVLNRTCGFDPRSAYHVQLVESVDTSDLSSGAARHKGSSPLLHTIRKTGGIGRRTGLRSRCPMWAYEFESHVLHQNMRECRNRQTSRFQKPEPEKVYGFDSRLAYQRP